MVPAFKELIVFLEKYYISITSYYKAESDYILKNSEKRKICYSGVMKEHFPGSVCLNCALKQCFSNGGPRSGAKTQNSLML